MRDCVVRTMIRTVNALPARVRACFFLFLGLAPAVLAGCYLSHERSRGRDFSSCAALGGGCVSSDLGCTGFGDTYAYVGAADCIERDEGYACCVRLADWEPSPIGERCFDEATCASGSCVEGVCATGRVCMRGGASSCGPDEHCWVPGDVSGYCLPRCDRSPCPGLLECTAGELCTPP